MSSSVPDRQPTTDNFLPSWWLPGPHSQTVWGRLARRRRAVALRREVLRTPDDDDLVVDHLDQGVTNRSARFVLLHGLEGSTYSVYIQGMLSVIARYGFAATAMNFRSCARDPNRPSRGMLPRSGPPSGDSGGAQAPARGGAAAARQAVAAEPQGRA